MSAFSAIRIKDELLNAMYWSMLAATMVGRTMFRCNLVCPRSFLDKPPHPPHPISPHTYVPYMPQRLDQGRSLLPPEPARSMTSGFSG